MSKFRSLLLTISLFLIFLLLGAGSLFAQQTVGLFLNDSLSYDGYTLYAASTGTDAFLIDNYGREVNHWSSGGRNLGGAVYLMDNGNLLTSGRISFDTGGTHLIEFDWDGNVVWEYKDINPSYLVHHDIARLPNGNVLVLARDFRSKIEADLAGYDTTIMADTIIWSELVYEIQPTGPTSGTIVWEWYIWDHLVQDFDPSKDNFGVASDHPELMHLNYSDGIPDWLHANALDYNPELDQIAISFRVTSEIWIIDHSTTTLEAASHSGGNSGRGGDILYRWGNPIVYGGGTALDQTISMQHNVQWIAQGLPGAGNLLIFDNGNDWGFSSVVEVITTVDGSGNYVMPTPGTAHGPSSATWSYSDTPPDSLYAWFISGCQRLPNGNTLICNGPKGDFREVTSDSQLVWRYINPITNGGPIIQGSAAVGNRVFRCTKYSSDFAGFTGKDMSPGATLEINPVTIAGSAYSPLSPIGTDSIWVSADLSSPDGVVRAEIHIDKGSGFEVYELFDDGFHSDGSAGDGFYAGYVGIVNDAVQAYYYIEAENGLSEVANDPVNPSTAIYSFEVGYSCGNIDGIMTAGNPMDISDLTYLVDYMFRGGPPPVDMSVANLDGLNPGGSPIDITDLTMLVDYFFRSGPKPTCGLK